MCTTTVGARLPIRLAAIFGALVRCYVGRPNRPSSEPITSTSTGERRTYRIFPAGPVWRYAASLAGSAEMCRSGYYYLGAGVNRLVGT